MHRTRLSQADAARIDQWRSVPRVNALPRVILCFSPYVRYAELERCSRGVDLAIPEATAVETLSRHVSRLLEWQDDPPRAAPAADCLPVQVISSDHELRAVLSEICLSEGFKVTSSREFTVQGQDRAPRADRAATEILTLWDIPSPGGGLASLARGPYEDRPGGCPPGVCRSRHGRPGQGVRSRSLPGSACGR